MSALWVCPILLITQPLCFLCFTLTLLKCILYNSWNFLFYWFSICNWYHHDLQTNSSWWTQVLWSPQTVQKYLQEVETPVGSLHLWLEVFTSNQRCLTSNGRCPMSNWRYLTSNWSSSTSDWRSLTSIWRKSNLKLEVSPAIRGLSCLIWDPTLIGGVTS